VSGHLADRIGGRRLVALGAVLSCAFNWLTSWGAGFWSLALPWALNGWAQSMGFAPATRLIAAWWTPRERGWAFGVFNFAAGFSSIVTYATAALVLAWLSWRWVFRLPVLLLLAGALVVLLLTRDCPEDTGLVPPGSAHPPPGVSPATPESLWQRLRDAFRNPAFLFASIGFGFANWARLGLLVWVPAHVVAAGAGVEAAWITLALPVGMALGALVAGDVTDRYLGGNHLRLIVIANVLASVAILGLLLAPPDARGLVLLFLAGFLVFGPFSSFTALAAELLGTRAVGAGVGFMNAVGYGAAALGDVVTGAVIDATGRTGAVFVVSAGACLLAALATGMAGSAVRRLARGGRPSG
jgi:MFS transporter, OPA family, glycerol-3-phosphate transporter